MAKIKRTDHNTIVTRERGSDVQITCVRRSDVRGYFDEEDVQFPFGEEFTAGLDEAQGACNPETETVLILVNQDDEA